jgi:hypothetical protein
MMRYRCAHCLRELATVDGEPEACPDHPEGSVTADGD